MIDDRFFEFIENFQINIWLFVLLGGIFFIFGNIVLTFIFGGKNLVKIFLSDKVALSWGFLVLGLSASLYILSTEYLTNALSALDRNGYHLLNFRLPWFVDLNSSLQYYIWPVSLIINTINSYRYIKNDRDVFFRKFSILEGLVFNVILGYMLFATIVKWIDVLFMSFRFLASPINPIKVIHPDEIYGLSPLSELVATFLVIAILVSSMNLVVYFRGQTNKKEYIYLTTVGIFIGIAFIFIIVPVFNNALTSIRQNALLEVTNDIINQQPIDKSNDINSSLLKYQILADLPKVVPLPLWLTFLGSTRAVIIIIEGYALLAKPLNLPKIPSFGQRIMKLLFE